MALRLYKKNIHKYTYLQNIPLAGHKNGLIFRSLKDHLNGQEQWGWHLSAADLLNAANKSPDQHTIVIDLKPSETNNVSLYELKDVWGFSYYAWTPVALRLETLFVDYKVPNPKNFKKSFIHNGDREQVHEFLYLQGGTGSGAWNWGSVGGVNGALLWPDALKFFSYKIMPSTVPIEIQREVLNTTHMTPEELKRELAVYLFQQGKLSFGKAREMADMRAWDFQFMLGSRNIPVHYDVEDYEEDRATLKELGRL